MPEQTPEQIGRQAGEAIANAVADSLEAVLMRLADAIARLRAEQDEHAEQLLDLVARIEHLERQASVQRRRERGGDA